MDRHSIIVCILLGIITTNLIRVVPMLLIKGQITNTGFCAASSIMCLT